MGEILQSNRDKLSEVCEDLKDVCNLTEKQVRNFIELVIADMLHNIAMASADKTDGKTESLDIEIPKIGCLHVKFKNGMICESDITLERQFKKSVERAVNELHSPLMEMANTKVIERIRTKYNSLI